MRRGYFVEGLGASQFGTSGAVDRLRAGSGPAGGEKRGEPTTVVLAASDPANPYGAALPWPDRVAEPSDGDSDDKRRRHQPGRKAGAVVVLVDGVLALYVERGGKTLLTFADDPAVLALAAAALADAVRRATSAGSPSRRPTAVSSSAPTTPSSRRSRPPGSTSPLAACGCGGEPACPRVTPSTARPTGCTAPSRAAS